MLYLRFFEKFNYETNDINGNHSRQKCMWLINFSISIPLKKKVSWNDGKYIDHKGILHTQNKKSTEENK
jgi:hypothetical protein